MSRSRSVMFEDLRIKADMQSSQGKETAIRRYFSCQHRTISPLPMLDEDWAVIESLRLLLKRHLARSYGTSMRTLTRILYNSVSAWYGKRAWHIE
jgi:hypothetical protein